MKELHIPSASGQAGLMVDSPPVTLNPLQLEWLVMWYEPLGNIKVDCISYKDIHE